MSRITNAILEAQIRALASIGTPAGKSWCLDEYDGGYRLVLRANDTGGIENISALSTRRELYHIIDGILTYTRIMDEKKGGNKMKLYQLFDKHITGSKARPPFGEQHLDRLEELLYNLPTGSGIDAGSTIVFEECEWNKIVFDSAYHVMDSNGYYDGWIEFKVIVRPSFTGFDLEIKPLQRKTYFNDYLHDYVFDVFYDALNSDVGDDE